MTKALPDDSELVARLLKKDSAAFNDVVTAWYSPMYYVASSIAGDAIADEVVQEAWFSVLRALPKFEGRSSLKSWVMRIVTNEAKTRRRKESRSTSLEQIEDGWATDPRFTANEHWNTPTGYWSGDSPDALMQAEELQNCIEKNIQKLPDNQRSVLMMRESGAYSLDDICNILNVTSSNVRVLLHRARDKVLQVIDRFEREGTC
nr:RNA polymerase sigma factor [Pleionea sp. CnH1-48]